MSTYAYMEASATVQMPRDDSAPTLSVARRRMQGLMAGAPRVGGSEYPLTPETHISAVNKSEYRITVHVSGIMRDRVRADAVRQWAALMAYLRNTFGNEPQVTERCLTDNYDVWYKAMERHQNKERRNGK